MLPANDVDPTEKLEREQAEAAVHELPKRLRTVIRARFWAERTLKEIGEAELGGISRERVRQLESDALDALERASGTPNGPTAKQQRAAARRRAA
jgi:RNA polymerase sigma factor (sigma-70 family)